MDLQNKLNEILRMASIEAYNLKSEYVSTEHILLAISKNDSLVKKVLLESGGNYEAMLMLAKHATVTICHTRTRFGESLIRGRWRISRFLS